MLTKKQDLTLLRCLCGVVLDSVSSAAKRLLGEFSDAKLVVNALCSTFAVEEVSSSGLPQIIQQEMEQYCVRYADVVASPFEPIGEQFKLKFGRSDVKYYEGKAYLEKLKGLEEDDLNCKKAVEKMLEGRAPEYIPISLLEIYGSEGRKRFIRNPSSVKVSVFIRFEEHSSFEETIASLPEIPDVEIEKIAYCASEDDQTRSAFESIEYADLKKVFGVADQAQLKALLDLSTANYGVFLRAGVVLSADYLSHSLHALERNLDISALGCYAQESARAKLPFGVVPGLMALTNTCASVGNMFRLPKLRNLSDTISELNWRRNDWALLLALIEKYQLVDVLPFTGLSDESSGPANDCPQERADVLNLMTVFPRIWSSFAGKLLKLVVASPDLLNPAIEPLAGLLPVVELPFSSPTVRTLHSSVKALEGEETIEGSEVARETEATVLTASSGLESSAILDDFETSEVGDTLESEETIEIQDFDAEASEKECEEADDDAITDGVLIDAEDLADDAIGAEQPDVEEGGDSVSETELEALDEEDGLITEVEDIDVLAANFESSSEESVLDGEGNVTEEVEETPNPSEFEIEDEISDVQDPTAITFQEDETEDENDWKEFPEATEMTRLGEESDDTTLSSIDEDEIYKKPLSLVRPDHGDAEATELEEEAGEEADESMDEDPMEWFQIFWSANNNFQESDSFTEAYLADETHALEIRIDADEPVKTLRLDPSNRNGKLALRRIEVWNASTHMPIFSSSEENAFDNLIPAGDFEVEGIEQDSLVLEAVGRDPQIILDLSESGAEKIIISIEFNFVRKPS